MPEQTQKPKLEISKNEIIADCQLIIGLSASAIADLSFLGFIIRPTDSFRVVTRSVRLIIRNCWRIFQFCK